jgi:hypothetical protein
VRSLGKRPVILPVEKEHGGLGRYRAHPIHAGHRRKLGTTVAALALMTAEEQLDWVEKYFQPYKGKLATLADLYMAILWPAGVGKPMEYVLWDQNSRPTTFRQNAGLDINHNGSITKAECAAKLYAMKAEGLQPGNMA